MNRISTISILTALVLAAPLFAGPMTYSGTKSAVFVDPVGGQSQGAGTNLFQFGGQNGSTLAWYGNPIFATTDGTPFKLGQIFLSNGQPIHAPSQVTFAVKLDFNRPAQAGTNTYRFATGITTTGRDSTGSFSINFDSGSKSTSTGSDGTRYTLQLLGLTHPWQSNSPFFNSLSANSCDDSNAYVWGKLTSDPPQVPEPSALLLGAIGIGIIGVRRWRNLVPRSAAV